MATPQLTDADLPGRALSEPEAHADHAEALAQTLFGRRAPSAADRVYHLEHGELRRAPASGSPRGRGMR